MSTRLKQEISRKLKEYGAKFGKDHMGGDDKPSAKKGGLRDFDGYDNVDYNRDMPTDEAIKVDRNSKGFKEATKLVAKLRSTVFRKFNDDELEQFRAEIANSFDLKENIQENFPSNWMQGRVSDYHTKNGTTPRDEYDKTNFNPKHSGQDDLEDKELEESGKDKSEKNYKAWKSSRIKKEIVRKLREWGSNLDNSYILDKDSILKGTPEDKDAIKREDIVDQAFNKAKVVDEACWKGYKQVGGKIKNGKQVPNCVPESVDNEIDEAVTESFKDMVGDTYTFSIGSGDEKLVKPNTKEYVIEKIAETIKHNLYDWDFSLNGIDGSQAKEYSKIFDNDVLKPLLRNIDKTLKTYFKIDSKNKKISWKLSFRDNNKIIDTFFKKNTKISSDIRDSYFSQNEAAKRDYKDEYKKFQSSTKSKKYRAELNKYNRDKGTYGNGDGKDASHKGGKIVGFESESKNRGRAEKSRLKKNK